MQNRSLKQLQERFTDRRYRQTLVRALAVIVVFCTTYALILPAITLEKDTAREMGGVDVTAEQATDLLAEEEETTAASSEEPDADAKAGEPQEALSAEDNAEDPAEEDSDPAAQDAEAAAFAEGEPITYEDDTIRVTAAPLGEEIPAGAELVVTPLTPDMDAHDAYFEALNRGFDADVYNDDNSLLYDVSILVGDSEYEPTDGKICISMEFKDKQLTEMLGMDLDENAPLRVIHLPVKGKSNSSLENVKASRIQREYVAETILDTDDAESVSFELESLSVVTVTGAVANITVNGTLSGTDRKTLDYPLYAYLKPETGGQLIGTALNFSDGNVSAVIPNVPIGKYTLYLVYPNIKYEANGTLVTPATLKTPRENETQVLDPNTTKWVSADGGNIFGYYADLPEDKTITADGDKSISFELKINEPQFPIDVETIMDRALYYGVTAEEVILLNNCYSNVAAKKLESANQNGNGGTTYKNRASGEPVPNIIAEITLRDSGQTLHTSDKDKSAVYYVPEDQTGKVTDPEHKAIVRNKDEIEDRVEIMISNTLKQTETLMEQSMLKIAKGSTSVDVSAYPDNATIIFDATEISGEQNGFTIIKRPGQTIVFNIGGDDVAVPQNTRVKLVDSEGTQVDVQGNPSNKLYNAGTEMNDAPAVEGNVWDKLIWNFPDAKNVKSSNCIGGIFLVPKGSFHVGDKGGGWIVARHQAIIDYNEWYAFPGTDTPFERKKIRKVFVGLTRAEIDSAYYIDLMTHTNDSTAGTSTKHVTNLVINQQAKKSDEEAIRSGKLANVGYESTGTDSDGNIYYEWYTPDLSVGSEHKLSEYNSKSNGNNGVEPYAIEFEGGFSAWHEDVQKYMWEMRHLTYSDTYGFNDKDSAVFNVRSYKAERAEYDTVTVTNYYKQEPHKLELTKVVAGISDDDTEYDFAVTLMNDQKMPLSSPLAYTVGEEERSASADGSGVFHLTLKDGETAVFNNLPFGTKYIIHEENLPDKCEVSYSGDTNGSAGNPGILYQDRQVTATNTYTIEPDAALKVRKVWKKANGDPLYDCPDEIVYDIYQVRHEHNWGEWMVVSEATEEQEGLERRECTTDSSHYETRTTSKLEHVHDWGEWTLVCEATTEHEGLEQRVCRKNSSHVETRSIPKLVPANTILGTTDLVLDETVKWPTKEAYPDQNTHITINPSGVFQYGDKYYVVYQTLSNTAGQFYNGPGSQNNNCVELTKTILTSANVKKDQNNNLRVQNAKRGDLYRADDGTYFVCIDAGNVQNNDPPTAQSHANCWYKIPKTAASVNSTSSVKKVKANSSAKDMNRMEGVGAGSEETADALQGNDTNAAINATLEDFRNREGYTVELLKTVTMKREDGGWLKETPVDPDTADTVYYYYVIERVPETGYTASYSGQAGGAKAGDTIEITNTQDDTNPDGVELPSTGGSGTTWIYLLGSMLILGCGILLIARRRLQ